MFKDINWLQNKALLAPLAGISNLPFRLVARSFGCSLAFTEMISANGLIRKSDKTLDYLRTSAEDQPLGVQIFGAQPDIMAEAARIVADQGAALIDINMGCPVKKVIKAGAGAILMKDPDRIGNAVARSRAALRESFRLHQHELSQPVELVLVARASIAGRGFAEVEKDFLAYSIARKLAKELK